MTNGRGMTYGSLSTDSFYGLSWLVEHFYLYDARVRVEPIALPVLNATATVYMTDHPFCMREQVLYLLQPHQQPSIHTRTSKNTYVLTMGLIPHASPNRSQERVTRSQERNPLQSGRCLQAWAA